MLIDRLHYALGLDTTELKQGWANADSILQTMDGKMAALATGAGIGALTLAIGKIGWAATNMAMEMDAAMGEVWSITDKTKEEMEGITKDILNLSTQIPERGPALAKAYYQTLSAGITDTNKALEVTAVSAKAATAGLTSTFTVVDAITNVLNAYKREASDAAEISDDLFIAVRDGKINMEQLAPAIGAVVGTAALAKVELKEVLAAIVAMTLSGYSVDESVTSINRLLLSIVDTQDEAKEAAKSLGIEWSVAGMQAKGFQAFIKDLNEKAGDNIEVLQKIVPEVRAFRAAAVIAGTGADAYAKSLDNLRSSAGATDQAFAKIMEDVKKQYELQKNRLNVAFTELGYKILPAVKDGLRIVGDAFEALGLAGETEAKRLQREWELLGDTIKSVGDIAARSAAMQSALTTLLAPGKSPMETLKAVEEVTNFLRAFPLISARAKEIQAQQNISAGELVEALQAELQAMKDIGDEARNAQLQDQQRIVSAQQLAAYQAEITRLKNTALALGETGTAQQLEEISKKLAASAKEWTDEKKRAVLADRESIQNQIAMASAAEAAKRVDEAKGKLAVDLADTSSRLLVSDAQLLALDKIRVSLAKQAAAARGDGLAKMKKMEYIKPSYQWMMQSTIQTTDRGTLPYGAFPTVKTEKLKAFNSSLEELYSKMLYGEDAIENVTAGASKFFDTLLAGDKVSRQAAEGVVQLFSGIIGGNPLGVFSGILDIFGSFNDTTIDATANMKRFTAAIDEYDTKIEDMTFQQMTELYQKMWTTVADKYGNFKRIPKGNYTDEQRAELDKQLANFGKWGDDFEGMVERWNYEVRLLNLEDPSQKMKLLAKYAKQYLGIELPENIENGFSAIKTFLDSLGEGKNIRDAWLTAFGSPFPASITDDQLREFVSMYQELLKGIQDATTEAASATNTEEESVAFSKTKQITYRQAEQMSLALWSIEDYARKMLTALENGLKIGGNLLTVPATIEITPEINWGELISRLNIYATNVFVNGQNCIVDVSKANVYLSGTSFNPETYSSLITSESTRALRSQGLAWIS